MTQKGLEYLRRKLDVYQWGVDKRYTIYAMKDKDLSFGLTIPPDIRNRYRAVLGWGAKAVDALADRLVFRTFANDNFAFNELFKINNGDILFDNAILSALIASCSFAYIRTDQDGQPLIEIIQASEATGILDPVTNLLTEGYAVLSRGDDLLPNKEAYFEPYRTSIYTKGEKEPVVYPHASPYAALVPIIHRPDSVRPFGRSRITRTGMYAQSYAKRTLERADITAEFYSWPQKYVTGLSQDAEPMEKWKATVSSMLMFQKDSEGDSPKLGQFNTPSMSPFTEQVRSAAAIFAGDSGLTLDDLGFVSDNPSSSEAIKASHENLRIAARKAQRNFNVCFINIGYVASMLRDNQEYKRDTFLDVKPKWYPVFEPDSSTLSTIGDGAIKVNQAVPNYFNKESLLDLTGIEGGE